MHANQKNSKSTILINGIEVTAISIGVIINTTINKTSIIIFNKIILEGVNGIINGNKLVD